MSRFKMTGADTLVKALNDRANLDMVQDVVRANGSEMQQKAQRYAPVDTGNLRRSINMQSQDHGLTSCVFAMAEYAPYVEWGTRYMYSQPYMKPAFKKQARQFKKDMKRLTR